MPRLVDPFPGLDYGPRQPPELNPQDSMMKVSTRIRKIDEGRIHKAQNELDTVLVAVSRCDASISHVSNNLITYGRRAFSRSYKQRSSLHLTTGSRAILLR